MSPRRRQGRGGIEFYRGGDESPKGTGRAVKAFQQGRLYEALDHAKAGGQALHLHRIIPDRGRAPRCFVRAVDKGEDIAHLFDQDFYRLTATALKLGVKYVKVERAGTESQHVDLCGGPLARAIALCEADPAA